MELIPILSTIILVATISTFLLSIGAYILYKIREKRESRVIKTIPSTIQAELVLPRDMALPKVPKEESRTEKYTSPFSVHKPVSIFSGERKVFEPSSQPKRYSREPNVREKELELEKERAREVSRFRKSSDTKYLKYTSAGLVPTEEDKELDEVKWR